MSWLFSRALVEEFSGECSWAGELCVPLSVMPTPHRFWRNDKTMEPSQLSRFGLTCAVLTADRGEALLTQYLEASRARTSRRQARARGSSVAAQSSGVRWHESSTRYDPKRSTWRTHRCLWDEDLPSCSVTLPKWGMTRTGVLWEPGISALPMPEIEFGWSQETLPTPIVAMAKGSSQNALTKKDGSTRLRTRLDYWIERDGRHGRLNPEYVEWVMGWPQGWTALQPLEMAKFREWQRQHSPSSLPNGTREAA
ncbi:hypothetical protein D9M68_513420 [compost metagenome]